MQDPIEKITLKCGTMSEDQSIKDLIKKLHEDRSNFIVVVNGDGRVAGIATENDLMKLMKLQPFPGMQAVVNENIGEDTFNQPVSGIMTKDPKRVKNTATTKDVLHAMISQEVRYLLVVDDENRPIGYVRLSDVMKNMVNE